MNDKIEFYLQKIPWNEGINVNIGHRMEQGMAVAQHLVFEYKEPGTCFNHLN